MKKLLGIAKEVSIALIQREETISVIESSSGGLISSSLLAQPGASAYYIGGQVVYTAKSIRGVTGLRLRDLKEKNIRSSSEPFALLLGEKGVEMYSTNWCITETGAAGPTGNGYGDPVSDHKMRRKEQILAAKEIRQKNRYKRRNFN